MADSSSSRESSPRLGQSHDMSTVQVPLSLPPHPLLQSLPPSTLLPAELLGLLNHTYFLHVLANDPAKVIQPGKSLLSMMSKPHARERKDGELPTLHDRVEEVIHKAFWGEAVDSLSSPQPSVQLPRLKLLYGDLHAVLKPLLPSSHIVLVTLSSPLSPTSAPLLSSILHLREILVALKERCAPARDSLIDALLNRLDAPSTPQLLVDTVRSILELAETMKDDLSQFVLGTMGEQQLRATVSEQARMQERALILDIWKGDLVEMQSKIWLEELAPPYSQVEVPADRHWLVRLVQSLGASTAVACPLPTKPLPSEDGTPGTPPPPVANALPPPFFMSTPEIQYIQNFLQAIVITSALCALLPSHPAAAITPKEDSFTRRIWSLLLSSVNDEPESATTKLLNLADELVQAAPPGADVERLRDSVSRTLQVTDPVFMLLQKRLLLAVAGRLATPVPVSVKVSPEEMRSGKDRLKKRHLAMEIEVPEGEVEREEPLLVKGFEDPVLVEAAGEGLRRLRAVGRWVDVVWRDVVQTNVIASVS